MKQETEVSAWRQTSQNPERWERAAATRTRPARPAGQGALATEYTSSALQTRLGPGDVRVELKVAFLFGSFEP